jgi:hypothetical protein
VDANIAAQRFADHYDLHITRTRNNIRWASRYDAAEPGWSWPAGHVAVEGPSEGRLAYLEYWYDALGLVLGDIEDFLVSYANAQAKLRKKSRRAHPRKTQNRQKAHLGTLGDVLGDKLRDVKVVDTISS